MEIQGFSDYLIYPDGRVFSKKSNRFLKSSLQNQGYPHICLWKNNKQKGFLIHRLVALHYIANPENKPEVDHKNRNKEDNRVENLHWVSRKENEKNKGIINRNPRKKYLKIRKNNKSGHKYIYYLKRDKYWVYKMTGSFTCNKRFKSKTDALCYKYIHLLKMKSISSL